MSESLVDENDDQYSSQIIEEEDLFFDDPSFDEESAALFAQAVAQQHHENDANATVSENQQDVLEHSLRNRLSGPSSHKAGLDSLDKDRIDQIIYEASKGSSFFENERKKDQALTKKIDEMLWRYDQIKHLDLTFETRVVDHKILEMESNRDLTQCICHVDMDAFYASVEELDDPSLKEVPMAVGGMSMLCTSNYLARKSGVRSGMPGFIALKLCPSLKMIPLHFPKYRDASAKVRAIFARYDPDFLPMSLDEAYLNLTKYLSTVDLSPNELVQRIRSEIFQETRLTASAGIAANRMLAKICSDMNKPNGQFYLPANRDAIMEFTKNLSIRKVSGVGRVTERVLDALDVKTCGDIYHRRAMLYKLLSPISFKFMLRCYLGIGSSSLLTESSRKSISVERTFRPISEPSALFQKVDELAELLAADLAKEGLRGKTVGIKLKLTSFTVRARAKTFPSYISTSREIARAAKELLEKELPVDIRLMGLRLSSLQSQASNDCGVKKYFSTVVGETKNKGIPVKRKQSDGDNDEDDFDNHSNEDTQGNNEAHPSCTSQPSILDLICPICNRCLQMDNGQFNHHVDECLTKVEVKAILQQQHSDTQIQTDGKASGDSKKLTSVKQSMNYPSAKSLLHYYSSEGTPPI